jgi:hypothetical protein
MSSTSNTAEVIDWDEAMQQCGEDEEFLRELLADLRSETDTQMAKIEETIRVRPKNGRPTHIVFFVSVGGVGTIMLFLFCVCAYSSMSSPLCVSNSKRTRCRLFCFWYQKNRIPQTVRLFKLCVPHTSLKAPHPILCVESFERRQ